VPDANPVVSVLTVNWNRRAFLEDLLRDLREQSVPGMEIVVVDNGSNDGSADMVAQGFPEVKLVRLYENVGHCAGLNAGLKAARSDIVVSLDNDALVAPGSMARIVVSFGAKPQLAALQGKIIDYDSREEVWWWGYYGLDQATYAEKEFATPWKIAEGLCALRRSAVLDVGGFAEEYFIMEAGRELAIRLIDAGYEIRYTPEIAFLHKAALVRAVADPNRLHSNRRMYFKLRNEIWTVWKHYPWHRVMIKTVFKLLTGAVLMLGRGGLRTYLRAVRDAFGGLPTILKNRQPARKQTIKAVEYSRLRAVRFVREAHTWYNAPVHPGRARPS
jgi:GT2 family glycosyltransferase